MIAARQRHWFFNAALSGRENIVLGGLAGGLSRRQVEARADDVTAFAGLEEFIDAPMRTYSSGMYSRLAFSVAVHMDPDILMIDEALSAGDASFKTKAAEKMQELRQSARAMFLVSHSLASFGPPVGVAGVRVMCRYTYDGTVRRRGCEYAEREVPIYRQIYNG